MAHLPSRKMIYKEILQGLRHYLNPKIVLGEDLVAHLPSRKVIYKEILQGLRHYLNPKIVLGRI